MDNGYARVLSLCFLQFHSTCILLILSINITVRPVGLFVERSTSNPMVGGSALALGTLALSSVS